MSNILSGTGSSLAHALSNASASTLAHKKIYQIDADNDSTGSYTVAIGLVSSGVFPSTLYSGAGANVATALNVSGLGSLTNPKVVLSKTLMATDGTVSVLAAVGPDGIPCNLYKGTGSTIAHALSTAGVSVLANPRYSFQNIARASTGSVTVIYGVTTDERVPR